jgi:hypothetical protein
VEPWLGRIRRRTVLGGFLLVVAGLGAVVTAGDELSRSDLDELELRRAEVRFRGAVEEYHRQEALRLDGLVSEADLRRQRAAVEEAALDVEKAVLGASGPGGHVTVVSGVKWRTSSGQVRVRVVVGYQARSSEWSERLELMLRELPRDVRLPAALDELHDVYVSLADEGFAIGRPYEVFVPVLKSGAQTSCEFDLLKNTDLVTVVVRHTRGVEERKLLLDRETSGNSVSLRSTSFSQVAELGGQATFDLEIERYTDAGGQFSLEVEGLPGGIRGEFVEPESGAKITQVRFEESSTVRKVNLVLFLPEVAGDGIELEEAIGFDVVTLFRDAGGLALSGSDARRPVGRIALQVVPRGMGQLVVVTQNFFRQAVAGEQFAMPFIVKNDGSAQLDNLRIVLKGPELWEVAPNPAVVGSVGIGEEVPITLGITVPERAEPGDYLVRVESRAETLGRAEAGETVTARIQVVAPPRVLLTAGVVLAVLIVGGGILYLGVRFVRR